MGIAAAIIASAVIGASTAAVAANQQKKAQQGAANEQKELAKQQEKLMAGKAPGTQTQDTNNSAYRRRLRNGIASTVLSGPMGTQTAQNAATNSLKTHLGD